MDWLVSLLRSVFGFLDHIVIFAITTAYNLFIAIANVDLFSDNALRAFSGRIYALLSIFMLFKLAFSIIGYVLNPDDMVDKTKGFSKLIANVFIVLLLIIGTPYIFSGAFKLQKEVVKQNIISKIILGVSNSGQAQEADSGKFMGFIVYSAFVTPNDKYPGMGSGEANVCKNMYLADRADLMASGACYSLITESSREEMGRKLALGLKEFDPYALVENDVLTAKANGEFLFNYTPLISTICGALVAWVLIIFCFDIAVRVVKLGFLQLISPIPIISYIDPKSSKDGMFKKWTKLCTKTYLDIFVRLTAITFAIYIIKLLQNNEMSGLTDNIFTNAFVRIFILLGALLFAKQVPKLIEDLTGIKIDGGFTLDPRKKIGAAPLVGGLGLAGMTLATNAAVGGLGAGLGGLKAAQKLMTGDTIGAKQQLNKVGRHFGRRMGASAEAARSQISSAGIMGSDKAAGESVRKALQKERADERKQKREGSFANQELERKKNLGEMYSKHIKAQKEKNPDFKTSDVFNNKDFKNSYDDVDTAKINMYALQNDAQKAQSEYSAIVTRDPNNKEAIDRSFAQLEEANRLAGKAKSRYDYLTERHKNIRKQQPIDAKIEDAIEAYEKINKEIRREEKKIDEGYIDGSGI